MKQSTYRFIKSIGIFLFLLLFGAFIFLVHKVRNAELLEATITPDSQNQDFLIPSSSQNRPMGFRYGNETENETDKTGQS